MRHGSLCCDRVCSVLKIPWTSLYWCWYQNRRQVAECEGPGAWGTHLEYLSFSILQHLAESIRYWWVFKEWHGLKNKQTNRKPESSCVTVSHFCPARVAALHAGALGALFSQHPCWYFSATDCLALPTFEFYVNGIINVLSCDDLFPVPNQLVRVIQWMLTVVLCLNVGLFCVHPSSCWWASGSFLTWAVLNTGWGPHSYLTVPWLSMPLDCRV